MCGFIAQLVEHRTGIAEVMGSNPFEALALVVRKPINANPRLNRQNPRSKFILRLNSVPRRPISIIQGLN